MLRLPASGLAGNSFSSARRPVVQHFSIHSLDTTCFMVLMAARCFSDAATSAMRCVVPELKFLLNFPPNSRTIFATSEEPTCTKSRVKHHSTDSPDVVIRDTVMD